MIRTDTIALGLLVLAGCGQTSATAPTPPPAPTEPIPGASYSTGPAKTIEANLVDCGSRARVAGVGSITAQDGSVWTTPAATNFKTGPKATDLFNECGGTKLDNLAALDLSTVPVADAGGDEVFTAYIFGDNYFELYVNGTLVGIDPVPFTPFNSNVIRFKAQRPVTLAVMAVDWEENLGLGSEDNRGTKYHPGDGGFVAQFRDASGATVAITDDSWHAQTFYTAPLSSPDCMRAKGAVRDSSSCSTKGVDDASGLTAVRWPVPDDWMKPSFNDAVWPPAVTFTNKTVGVDNKAAYTRFTDVFDDPKADPQFIWSSNLVLDNLVLMRTVIQ